MAIPGLYLGDFILHLIATGMMRHLFATSDIDGLLPWLIAGLGVGLFFVSS